MQSFFSGVLCVGFFLANNDFPPCVFLTILQSAALVHSVYAADRLHLNFAIVMLTISSGQEEGLQKEKALSEALMGEVDCETCATAYTHDVRQMTFFTVGNTGTRLRGKAATQPVAAGTQPTLI